MRKNGLDLKEIYREEIEKHIRRAEELASSPLIPEGIYKDLLKEAPRYIVNAMICNIGMTI